MRTTQEILDRIKEIEEHDFFGTARADLICVLPFDAAKPFLLPDADEGEWAECLNQDATIRGVLADYLPFAIDKAVGHRGLSASRSIEHMRAWLWLLGDDELLEFCDSDYQNYGAPILKAVADKYAPEVVGLGGERFLRMAEGLPCAPDCSEGCVG